MRRFALSQIISLSILCAIVIILATMAFITGANLTHTSDPCVTPNLIIELDSSTCSPAPTMPTDEICDAMITVAPEDTSTTKEITPTSPASTDVPDGIAFVLTIAGRHIEISDNVEEETLKEGPGWLNTSAAPGQDGVCVVFGHRNRNHLRVLEKVAQGEAIIVTMPDGSQITYMVKSIEIATSDAELHIPTLEGEYLMLVTCYPFYYTGHAPKKYIVLAKHL